MDITTADLQRAQDSITATVRHEVGLVRDELKDLRAWQKEQDARADRHERAISRLQRHAQSAALSVLRTLTPKQKAAVWSAALGIAGVIVERGWHVAGALIQLYAKGQGVQP